MSLPDFVLRPYAAADEGAALDLWRRTWQAAYPAIDFTARLAWWSQRWQRELVPECRILVAETKPADGRTGQLVGFVTVDPVTGYLDQIVVAPEAWGGTTATALLDAAKRVVPAGLELHVNQDNQRAIRFYEKHGFRISGQDVNPRSGAPIHRMTWRP